MYSFEVVFDGNWQQNKSSRNFSQKMTQCITSVLKVLQCITAELLHTEVVSKCNNCNLLVNTQFILVMKFDHVLFIWPVYTVAKFTWPIGDRINGVTL